MNRRSKKSPVFLDEIGPLVLDERDPLGRELFLGRYDRAQLMDLLESCGLMAITRAKGYREVELVVLRQDDLSRLYLNSLDPPGRLIELVLREASFRPRQVFIEGFDSNAALRVLEVQWLSLQHPNACFGSERPRLPGQACPGLGGLRQMQVLLNSLASGLDAILNVPERYHTAVIYAEEYHFFAPAAAGQLLALVRDLGHWPLGAVSAAIESGCLVNLTSATHEPWQPSEQLAPISARLKAYFEAPAYRDGVNRAAEALRYTIDWVQYERIKNGVDLNE